MEISKATSLPSSSYDDQHPDPDDYVHKSEAEVSFGFNHLQINDKNGSHSHQLMPAAAEIDNKDQEEEDDEDDDDEEDEDEEEGDFTFMCIADKDSPITDDVEDGQIRTVFPLFDQTLLLGSEYDEGRRRLPISVPVDNVFIESPRRSPSSMASGNEETNGVSTGTFRALSKESDNGTTEINMKSNSTGFSKLWRFRDKMNRSNSDGRDAFVFLEGPDNTTTRASKPDAVAPPASKLVNAAGKEKVVKKVSKAKKAKASAHEVYLKQKGEQTEEERRRSYLPYRPGVMGFFTNVNGGLSRNVHPF